MNYLFKKLGAYAGIGSMLISTAVQAAPLGGQVTAGSAQISQSGATTTITQQSANASLSWQGFNVSSNETVNFVQPNSSAIAVNRILGNSGSQIFGHLNANGQVWLINPNGILFGQGSQINVGGLVASTLDIADSSITSNTRQFKGYGLGSIINQGSITAANGGYIALLGNQVSNQGYLSAQLGTIALGAGSVTTLTFNGNQLLHLQVDESTLNNLAENKQLIQADGGQVIMSAGAKDSILASVVNNTGTIQAQTVENHNGTITLLGGMTAGTTNVDGTLDASAPNGGNGGFIETSAANVNIADTAKVTTLAPTGTTGTWLIDPNDYTVAASGGDQTGAQLTASLNTTNVTLLSSSGATSGSGNININDTVSWSANNLTLTAANNINVNAVMTATGTASLDLNPATANGSDTAVAGGAVNMALTSSGFTGRIDYAASGPLNINGTQYTVINSLGSEGSTTSSDLQGINGNLSGHYVLGSNINASATTTWNGGAGFTPIGYPYSEFTGNFSGLGHSISNIFMNLSFSLPWTGLITRTGASNLQGIGLINESLIGGTQAGGLVGENHGMIANSYVTGSISGAQAGGLVGTNFGMVSNSYANVNASGSSGGGAGGLVAINVGPGTIVNSYATGNISNSLEQGGLVGSNYGAIINSYATGNVTNGYYQGGLVGSNHGAITNSYATGNISNGAYQGGLVGVNYLGGTVTNVYATGNLTNANFCQGGLVGCNSGQITNAYATGNVASGYYQGGLVGYNSGQVANTYATGNVSLTYLNQLGFYYDGGLVGFNSGQITNSYWNKTTSGQASSAGGVGLTTAQMQQASNFSGFYFTTTPGATGNNWVMVDADGTLNNAGGAIGATFPMLASEYSTNITNAHQLQLMVMNLNANYTLANNINAANTNTSIAFKDIWSTSGGFVPVGNQTNQFTGTLSGYNNWISDLYINLPSTNQVGLFGVTGTGSLIESLVLNNNYVSGNGNVGGLVGTNMGIIKNTGSNGEVVGNQYNIGGLVGFNNSYNISLPSISNSYSTGNVISPYGANQGGLVGYNSIFSLITNSYATGNVSSGASYLGGLVGYNDGFIMNSYAAGNVCSGCGSYQGSGGNLGGLAGFGGTITNSYATGNVSSTFGGGLGGLVGLGGTVTNSYATGNVSSGSGYFIGGLVGTGDTITNSYATGNVTSGKGDYIGGLTGNAITITNSYATGNVRSLSMYGDYSSFMGGLAGSATTITNSYASGNVISSGGDYLGGLVGAPIGVNSGFISIITNSYATGFVNGNSKVGGLVGANAGSIIDSHASGNVTAVNTLGGLVGLNKGRITSSLAGIYKTYATGDVTSISNNISGPSTANNDNLGGLVGLNYLGGSISYAYASGVVTDLFSGIGYWSNAGGLVGLNLIGSSIDHCYATGPVNGAAEVGGLVGANGGTIQYSYATGNTTATLDSAGGLVGYNGGVLSGDASIINSYATGNVAATNGTVGGLVGYTGGNVQSSYGTGSVSGEIGVGGLAGWNDGSVTGSFATGSVNGTNKVGGLIGGNTGSVSGSYATSSVVGVSYVGGLIGFNDIGSITNSYSMGNVSGTVNNIGGLVGTMTSGSITGSYSISSVVGGGSGIGGLVGQFTSGTLDQSYATGNVQSLCSCYSQAGGLVGNLSGSLTNSYSTGSVTGTDAVGGLVGTLQGGGVINTAYATGAVNAVIAGGLVGQLYAGGGSIINSFWNTTTSGQLTSAGGVGLTTAQMRQASSFAGFNFTTTPGATGNNWVMVDADGTLNNAGVASGATFPMLASEYSTNINNAHQLQLMAMNLSGNYTLASNINATNTNTSSVLKDIWSTPSGFVPIGKGSDTSLGAPTPTAFTFNGNFDGKGYGIGNLYINTTSDEVGLFGFVSGSTIQNVGLLNANILGGSWVGSLVGFSDSSSISNTYSTGTVTGLGWHDANVLYTQDVGGLIGGIYNGSTLNNSYSNAIVYVTSGNEVGGLVGIVKLSSISNSYATGNIFAGSSSTPLNTSNTGGLVGKIHGGSISNSFASGDIVVASADSSNIGGLVGRAKTSNNTYLSTITNSYATGNISTGLNSTGIGGLVGSNDTNNFINNTYSKGAIVAGAGSTYVGGLVGIDANSVSGSATTITNSYWNTATSGQLTSSGGIGLSTDQMMQSASFASWNTATPNTISNIGGTGSIWRIYEGHTSPLLSSFMTELTLSGAPDKTVTYNGTAQSGGTASLVPHNVFGSAATGTNAGFYNGYYSNQQGYNIIGGNLTITPLPVNVVLNGAKVYDGTSIFSVSQLGISNAIGLDQVSLISGTASTADKNVGVNKAFISFSGLELTGASAGNYTLNGVTGSGTINPLALTGSIATGSSVYGSTLLGGAASFTNAIVGDNLGVATVAVDTTGNTSSSGKLKAGNYTRIESVTALSGIDAGNYTFTGITGNYNVSQLALTVNGSVAASKAYDGTVAATLTGATLSGPVVGDFLTLTQTGYFADKNVGTAKVVTANDVLSGLDALNYTLIQPTGLSANISPRVIALTGTRVYDGTTTAAGTILSASNLLGGDTLTFTGSATLAAKIVGSESITSVTGLVASNANYTLAGATGSVSITPKALTVTGTVVANKVYDGTTTATVTTGALSGVISGDVVTLTQAGAFASKNAGTAVAVIASDTISGAGASNYTLTQPTLTANITPKPLTVTGTSVAANKVYDGTTLATVTGGVLSTGVIAGDTVTLVQAGTFASKNVGTGLVVTLADSLLGASAANYSLTQPAAIKANITAKALTVAGTTVASMVYNGTTTATLTGGSLVGVVAGDVITLTQTGTYAAKNVGTAVAVTAKDTIAGTGVANYTLTQPTGLTGAITPKALTLTGTVVANKVYNGTTAATLTGGALSGLITGDVVTLTQTGTFASKNVGTGIAVTVADVLAGTGATNYTLTQPTGLKANITPKALTVTGTVVANKVYDGTTTATVSTGVLSGVIAGDVVTLTQAGIFASKNVGTGIAVTVADVLGGTGATNYTLTQPTGLKANITPRPLVLTGKRLANGSTSVLASILSVTNLVIGDALTLGGSVTLAAAAKGVQAIKTFTTLTLAGTSSANYTITGASGSVTLQ